MSCKPMSGEEFIRRARLVHGDKYNYDKIKYTLRSKKITITCPEHGDFEQIPHNHLNKNGCRECWKEQIKLRSGFTISEFLEKAKSLHNDKYDYSKVEYVNSMKKICVICPIHGEFYPTPNNHLTKKSGCPKCKKSKGELAIIKILDKYGILHTDEYKLPFYNYEYDFYLPQLNTFIEFHGIQHYQPIGHFGGMKIFNYTQKCDAFKRSLAREYKIPLIEFNYKQFESMSETEFEELVIGVLKKHKDYRLIF